MSGNPETSRQGKLPARRHPAVDKTHLAILALICVGALAFGIPIILFVIHGGTAAARYTTYAGIVLICLGFLLMGLRGRRQTLRSWGITPSGFLFQAGYAVYLGAAGTMTFGLVQVSRLQMASTVRVSVENAPEFLATDNVILVRLQVGVVIMLVFLALMLLDFAHLQVLRSRAGAEDWQETGRPNGRCREGGS